MLRIYILLLFFAGANLLNAQQQCNDLCTSVTTAIVTNPTDPNCGDFTPVTIAGCLENASVETIISECGADTMPTVWFRIDVDEEAVQLGISIVSNGQWKPVWAIYQGTCESLSVVNGGTLADPIPCSNGDNNSGVHVVGVVEGVLSYWVAVSGKGVIDDDPSFTLNAWTSAACVSCIGDEGCNPISTWTVTSRSSGRELDDPLFCEGEEVTVCIDYAYDASNTGVDWLHGLIPNFGPGWDMDAFDGVAVSVTPSNGLSWHSEDDGACAPIINEQMPLLCTYQDPITGKLKICNVVCEPCPCAGPLVAGSPLPSGWFWNTNGGVGCANDCSPATHYGIGQVVVDINFCMDLKVRTYDNDEDCEEFRDLQINFQTTSDGVSGCWNDPIAECKLDKAQIGPKWEIDCRATPSILADDATLVGEGILNIPVSNADGNGDLKLFVSYIDNPFVEGERLDTFAGNGVIDHYLVNTSSELQVVKYIITSTIEGILCNNSVAKIVTVLIYPAGFSNEVNLTLFKDKNNNEIFDAGEKPLKGFRVDVPSNNHSYFSDKNGKVTVLTNLDTLVANVSATYGLWDSSTVSLVVPLLDSFATRSVGFRPYVDTTYNIKEWIWSQSRCNAPSVTTFGFMNFSQEKLVSGTAVLLYDTKISNSVIVSGDGIHYPSEKRVEWALDSIGQGQSFNGEFNYIAPSIMSNNDSLTFDFYIITENDDTIGYQRDSDLLRCSYDPNDKRVFPDRQGVENYILPGEELQYVINFQNVGNDTAYNVVITDDLDDRLDFRTMVVLYASHAVTTEATGDNLIFNFKDIYLPDSTRSPLTSQGYVVFSISPKANLAEGTEIHNTAKIYFDFNDPVITNTTNNTLVNNLPCPQNAIWIEENALQVNPSNGLYHWYDCANDVLVETTEDASYVPLANGSYYCIIDGYFCSSKSLCIVYDKISGASSYDRNAIKVFPNPGTDEITITAKSALGLVKIENIADVNGRVYAVPNKYRDEKFSVDTSLLPSGVYIIQMRAENGQIYSLKWVKL
jgi:uncharacterized repeat protein (TIGR01451 family)